MAIHTCNLSSSRHLFLSSTEDIEVTSFLAVQNLMTVSENIQNLRRVKIHFDNEKDEENGFYELMVSGMPAIALDNGRYLANALQLKVLEKNGINYVPDANE
jgi:hypothetical protein